MGKVILFPCRLEAREVEIDLYTAVDVAIRDLRDIAHYCGEAEVRRRADECRQMLESAYESALGAGA
jgi:hypothetical protein